MKKFESACYCGKVRCSFTLPVKSVVQCHCNICRTLQGTDYSTWVAVEAMQFTIEAGEEYLTHYQVNDRSSKNFCSQCGTGVYAINGKHFSEHRMVPLGTVDNYSTELKPKIQAYAKDKAAWVQLHDEIPILTKKGDS